MSTIKDKYKRQLKNEFNWESIKHEALNNPQENYLNDFIVGTVFLGTVFSMCPSGKYYLPFACSNVNNCPICKGLGYCKGDPYNTCSRCQGVGSHEAYQDIEWYAALDEIAEKYNGYIAHGEGDPCDIFFEIFIKEI